MVGMFRKGIVGEADGDTGLEADVLGGVQRDVEACSKETLLEDLLSESSVDLLS